MKIVMEPIEAIAWFSENGQIKPIKFRVMSSEEYSVVKVEQVIVQNEERLAGNKMLVFRCCSSINNCRKIYELKYEVNTCKWYLYKI